LAETPRPHLQHDGDGQLPNESREGHGLYAAYEEQRRERLPRQPREQSIPSSPQLPSIKSNSIPSLEHLSEESLKEYFLKNIYSEFVNEAPLLIEDKLKDLFSQFLSELSGTMETFPGTLLESCVSRLSASIQEIITADVIPALFERVFNHLNEFPMSTNKNERLLEFVNDKLDSLQDIIIGLDSENTSVIEKVLDNVKVLEHEMSSSIRTMRVQISENEDKENMRFEQIKRRLGDFHSSMNSMNNKLDFIVNNLQKIEIPQMRYNNPLMNEWTSQPEPQDRGNVPPPPPSPPSNRQRNQSAPQRQQDPFASAEEVTTNTPQWEKEFPFIKHNDVDPEMRKELWKSIPKTSE
jgi:hypothetical protein